MRSLILLIPGFILAFGALTAQAGSLGPELRAYPAGLIPGLRGEVSVGETDLFLIHAGYNSSDRHDWGEHADESGGGGGLGLGWLHRLGSAPRGWFLGGRVDYWQLEIDWEDPGRSGRSNVDVLQPTAVGGYRRDSGRWHFEASLSAGREINLSTDGEDVGQGWILLAGLGALFGI